MAVPYKTRTRLRRPVLRTVGSVPKIPIRFPIQSIYRKRSKSIHLTRKLTSQAQLRIHSSKLHVTGLHIAERYKILS